MAEVKVSATEYSITKEYGNYALQSMHLTHEEARKLADDIYEKLGVAHDSYAWAANEALQGKLHEKDVEITSLIAKNQDQEKQIALLLRQVYRPL